MAKAKLEKKIAGAVPSFETILVCNDKHLRPFVEAFVFEPENVTQKNLGTLLGVFEITDPSDDSSYIVNYLSSVIKKEYFSKPKRTPIDSFEAALHRANLALSKLAEHGNVKWLGKFNALVAIIEKNNLHLTQTGTASAFLLRAKGLTEISESLSPNEAEPHPLKTFVNVSSGRLELQDKLLITTDGIFEIFSTEEIKKSALRFSDDKFIQFLKTALGHELEKAAVLVVDMLPPDQLESAPAVKKNRTSNAFSQSAFARDAVKKPSDVADETKAAEKEKERPEISEQVKNQIKAEINHGGKESTEEQRGHIYIKETLEERLSVPPSREYLSVLNEKFDTAKDGLKKISKKSGIFLLNTAKSMTQPKIAAPKDESAEPEPPKEIEHRKNDSLKIVTKDEEIKAAKPLPEIVPEEIVVPEIKTSITAPQSSLEKITAPALKKSDSFSALEKFSPFSSPEKPAITEDVPPLRTKIIPYLQNLNVTIRSSRLPQTMLQKTKHLFVSATKDRPASLLDNAISDTKKTAAFFLPDFSKIKKMTAHLDHKQKFYAILVIVVIIVIPFFGLKMNAYLQSQRTKPIEPPAAAIVMPLVQDKNVVRVASIDSIYSENGTLIPVNLNGKMFAVSQAQITDLATKTPTPIPADFGQVKMAAGMDDLNVIFLLSQDNEILSFSPAVGKFQPNSITIPDNSNIAAAGTYLTYLYLVDSKNNQIYRYPRATGGFGAASNWLKDAADLSRTSGMALSDNIFIADGTSLSEFFKGKKQTFALESTATPITPSKVFTKPDFSNVYVLDKQNSRIIKTDKSGIIVAQYYDAAIASADDFMIDEAGNTAYFSVPGKIMTLQMN